MTDASAQDAITVPWVELSDDALKGVIEAFILREGTDYGEREVAFEVKFAQVLAQLKHGGAKIMFDPVSEPVSLVTAQPRWTPQ